MKEYNSKIIRVIVFFTIAVVLSNIFRFDLLETKALLEKLPVWIHLALRVLLEGSGVFIGALIGLYLLRKERKTQISLFGTSQSKALLMSAIPVVLLGVIGVKNGYGIQENVYGLLAVVLSLVYCIMEEYGWRGYLQEELKDLQPLKRYLLIGFLWYVWHLSFLSTATVYENLFFLLMLLVGSWGIGQVAASTKSILASACFHLVVQIMMFNSLIKNGLDGTQKVIVLGVSIVLWIIILGKWKKDHPQINTASVDVIDSK